MACVVIVYHYKINEQTHYTFHESEVSAITVSKKGICASGERGKNPTIHIWDIKELKPLIILKGDHKSDIYLLNFVHNDMYLVSCGKRLDTPIFIHDIDTGAVVFSTHVDQFIRSISSVNNLIGEFKSPPINNRDYVEGDFVMISAERTYYFTFTGDSYMLEIERDLASFKFPNEKSKVKQDDSTLGEVTAVCCFYVNKDNPELKAYASTLLSPGLRMGKQPGLLSRVVRVVTGHSNGFVVVWEFEKMRLLVEGPDRDEQPLKWVNTFTEISSHEVQEIVALENSVCISTVDFFIHIMNLDLTATLNNIDLSSLPFKLYSMKLKNVVAAKEKLFFNTEDGDIIMLYLKQKKECSKNTFIPKLDAKRIKNVFKLKDSLTSLTLIERNDEKVVFVTGEASVVYGISTETHELIDMWSVGDSITAMDSLAFPDGGTINAFGSAKGKILLRLDWEEIPKPYDCKMPITDIKLTSDANYLVATSENKEIFVFTFKNNSYFNDSPNQ